MVTPGVSGRDAGAFNVDLKVKIEPTIRFKALFVTVVDVAPSLTTTVAPAGESIEFVEPMEVPIGVLSTGVAP